MIICLIGYIGVTDIYEVGHRVEVPREGRDDDCILDAGYKRLRIFSNDKNYAIHAIFNDKLEFVEFYIDIIKGIAVDVEINVPYMEDLYVDIVYTNKDEIIVLDEDELEDALNDNNITKSEYDIAIKAKNEVVCLLSDKLKADKLISYCSNNLKRLLPKVR